MSINVNTTKATDYIPAAAAPTAPKPAAVQVQTDSTAAMPADANTTVARKQATFAVAGSNPDTGKLTARLEELAASGERIDIGYDQAASVAKDDRGNFSITTYNVINGFAGRGYEEDSTVTVGAMAISSGNLPRQTKDLLESLMPTEPRPATEGMSTIDGEQAFTWTGGVN
jgi:hypothetical protein